MNRAILCATVAALAFSPHAGIALAAQPDSMHHEHAAPPATPALPAVPPSMNEQGIRAMPAMPPESSMPPAPTDRDVQVQANPPGAGMPSWTPPNPPTAGFPVRPAMPADPAYHAGPYKGALTPPPAEAMNKVYPVCTRTLQDSCRNPGGR